MNCNSISDRENIITLEEFRQYANYYEENTDDICRMYIGASCDIVKNYLGYDPVSRDYLVRVSGTGTPELYTAVPHINSIGFIEMDGNEIDPYCYTFEKDHITLNDGVFEEGLYNIQISYNGGWRRDETPYAIRMAVLRIASLMLAEQGGNIGVTSKSFSDQTRTFVNYSNYNKFLQPLAIYKSRNF